MGCNIDKVRWMLLCVPHAGWALQASGAGPGRPPTTAHKVIATRNTPADAHQGHSVLLARQPERDRVLPPAHPHRGPQWRGQDGEEGGGGQERGSSGWRQPAPPRPGVAFPSPPALEPCTSLSPPLLQTVIECLKMACTGELPPNTRSGQSFIHDPKACLPQAAACSAPTPAWQLPSWDC